MIFATLFLNIVPTACRHNAPPAMPGEIPMMPKQV